VANANPGVRNRGNKTEFAGCSEAVCTAKTNVRSPCIFARDRVDWGEAVDVSQFYGRQAQLAMLEEWVMQDCCRLITIMGIGDIGKTMLVTQLAEQLGDTE